MVWVSLFPLFTRLRVWSESPLLSCLYTAEGGSEYRFPAEGKYSPPAAANYFLQFNIFIKSIINIIIINNNNKLNNNIINSIIILIMFYNIIITMLL